MIHGEGTRPSTSEVTSRDPFDELSTWLDQKREPDDASNALSAYSSCEESEFERYCSANSVMGTASLSSSLGTCNDFLDSDFGSSRSLGFGRFGKIEFQNEDVDTANRARANWKITNWKKSLPSPEGNSVSVGFNSEGSGLFRDQRMGSLSPTGAEKRVRDDAENSTRREFHSLLKSSGEENLDELTYEPLNPYDQRESGRGVGEDEETSSMHEYSGDDDAESILSYGSDDERRIKLNYRQELKTKNENPILMNSSVAFGSDDWDDFIQESEQKSLASTLFDIPQETQWKHLETGETFVQSASAAAISVPNIHGSEKEPIARDIPALTGQVNGIDNFQEDMVKLLIRDSLTYKDPLAQETPGKTRLTVDAAEEKELHRRRNEEASGFDKSNVSGSMLGNLKLELDPLFESTVSLLSSCVIDEPRGKEVVVNLSPSIVEDNLNIHLKTMSAYSSPSVEQVQHSLPPIKVGNLDSTEDYDEVVLEMEEILLDSTESHGARFPQSNRASPSQLTQPFRDGSSTASISGTDDPYPLIQHPSKVDWVEVVGAKQKKGDVSLGERIVGVKEYTVYLLRVWSGKSQWEVERRYRDFFTLFRQLKTLFADHGWTLPAPWSRVEQESRKIFGNASPDVVSQRSALIQECLRSILHSGFPHSTQNILIWFLSPQKVGSSSSKLNTSLSAYTAGTSEDFSSLGKTISLLVETQARKPSKQLLEAQHYSCAGCHKRLDAEKTLVLEFVQTLGWGKPRLCEYTGQLFCASCHTNDTAVLPARVLHFWDFAEYPVSQFAKSYLESIYDQPMLCVSAVNPFLFSKVPALFRVMGFRKKIGAMMPYVRCPFRRSIQRGVGSRRYLLESNEFFALRDLVDLSKGAFSALPVMVETVFKKILEHITQRCLVCCDVGIPCGARQACEDPSSLIFPFQEDEVKRCNSCQTVFHKSCFQHLSLCPCGVSFKPSDNARYTNQEVNCVTSNELDMTLDASAGKPASGSSLGFLSSLFSKVKQEKVWGSKNGTPVILMGSLPNTFSDPL